MTQKMTARALAITMLLGATSLAGCASQSFGDGLQVQGEALTGAGQDWEKGRRLVEKGERRLAEARRDETDALALIEQGQRLKADAEQRAQAAR